MELHQHPRGFHRRLHRPDRARRQRQSGGARRHLRPDGRRGQGHLRLRPARHQPVERDLHPHHHRTLGDPEHNAELVADLRFPRLDQRETVHELDDGHGPQHRPCRMGRCQRRECPGRQHQRALQPADQVPHRHGGRTGRRGGRHHPRHVVLGTRRGRHRPRPGARHFRYNQQPGQPRRRQRHLGTFPLRRQRAVRDLRRGPDLERCPRPVVARGPARPRARRHDPV